MLPPLPPMFLILLSLLCSLPLLLFPYLPLSLYLLPIEECLPLHECLHPLSLDFEHSRLNTWVGVFYCLFVGLWIPFC